MRACLRDFVARRLRICLLIKYAMDGGEPILYHSHLSGGCLICTCCDPKDVVVPSSPVRPRPINSVESVVRRVIGWREFVRGVY